MTRIVHISDLHFGRVRAELTRPLLARIAELDPDLVAISGDLTQRARRSQFRAARAFIDQISAPVLVVPGNHDTPLDNLFVRFLQPWDRWRKYIGKELEPVWRSDDVTVAGFNTVNRYAWQRGRVKARTRARISMIDRTSRLTVVVLHHPLEHPPETDKAPPRGARKALAVLDEAGADIVLSGHLHTAVVQPFVAAPGVLFVQAGTGLSTRLRDEDNSFNLLTIADGTVTIDRYAAAEHPDFARIGTVAFRRVDGTWQESTPPDPIPDPPAPSRQST